MDIVRNSELEATNFFSIADDDSVPRPGSFRWSA
jgi:hypothetical protein